MIGCYFSVKILNNIYKGKNKSKIKKARKDIGLIISLPSLNFKNNNYGLILYLYGKTPIVVIFIIGQIIHLLRHYF